MRGAAPGAPGPLVVLAERHEGVRTALREQLEAAGAAEVVAEAGTVAAARAAADRAARAADGTSVVVVAGLTFPDGTAADLIGPAPPALRVVVVTWLPPDERGVDLSGAAAVVGLPLIPGLIAALRDLAVA